MDKNSLINLFQILFWLVMLVWIIRNLIPYVKKNNRWQNIALVLDSLLGIAIVAGYLSAVFAWFIERDAGAKQVWMYIFIFVSIIFAVSLVARIYIWRKKILPMKKMITKDSNK